MNLYKEGPFHLIDWHDMSEGVGGAIVACIDTLVRGCQIRFSKS
jgi:hypothetical protein